MGHAPSRGTPKPHSRHGLALGGVAKAGQTQLLQTPLTLVLAALVLGEHITILAIVCTVAVLASIVGTQRARVERR